MSLVIQNAGFHPQNTYQSTIQPSRWPPTAKIAPTLVTDVSHAYVAAQNKAHSSGDHVLLPESRGYAGCAEERWADE